MAKSRARFLSELLGTTGLVKKSKSALAGADEIIDLSTLPSIPNSKLTNSSITINSSATSLGGSVTLTTANVAENTNLYYTDARADARIAAADTGDLSEGSNLYYTDARADARVNLQTGSNLNLSSKDTGDLSEGSNLYYTNARADARIAAADTGDLSEGSNLYYTDARADARVALVVDSAPSTLNTLNELAAALGDDANFSTTVTNSIAAKLPLAGGTLTGTLTVDAGSSGMIDFGNVTTAYGRLYADNSGTFIGSKSNHPLILRTNHTTALTLDTSQNATFAGSVIFGSNGKVLEIADAPIQWYSLVDSAYKSAAFRAVAYTFKNGGNTPIMTIGSGGNTSVTGTFNSGAITSGAISATGAANSGSASHLAALLASGSYGGGIATRDTKESGWYQQTSGADWHFYHNRTVASDTPASKIVLSFNSSGNATFAGTISSGAIASTGNSTHGGYSSWTAGNGTSGIFQHYNSSNSYRGYFDWRTLQLGNNGVNNILAGNTSTGGYFKFWVNATGISQTGGTSGINALTISAAGNSTFSGSIDSGAITSTGLTVSTTYPKLQLNSTSGVPRNFSVGTNNETFTIRNETASSDSLTISNANIVNIPQSLMVGATTAPTSTLHIKTPVDNSVSQGLVIERSANSDKGYINYQGGAFRMVATDGDPIRFGHVSSSNEVSIHTDGSLLVGKTTDAFGTAGIALRGTVADFIRDGGPPINVNRLTSDGDLIILHKGGTNVGSIGTFGTDLYIGTNDTGLRFEYAGLNAIVPFDVNSLAISDAAINLGHEYARFNDAHFSGTVNTNAIDLAAIAESKTDTAVDVFVYDTRKDSDGGAWRKRTQHTSWYNEASGSTRSSRKEFPSVAVIVAKAYQVTIYDGDDPDLPMWMVWNDISLGGNKTIKSVTALNGIIAWGTNDGSSVSGALYEWNFLAETKYIFGWYGNTYRLDNAFSNRTIDGNTLLDNSRGTILQSNVNDVAMTVLPNAPIDADTGLPVPTIAVGTSTGLSIIKDDGTVINRTTSFVNSSTPGGVHDISFDNNNGYWYTNCHYPPTSSATSHAAVLGHSPSINTTGVLSSSDGQNYEEMMMAIGSDDGGTTTHWSTTAMPGLWMNSNQYPPEANAGYMEITPHGDFANRYGLHKFLPNYADHSASAVAYVASDYNTGYMVGRTKLATLSDTSTTNAVSTDLLGGIGNFTDSSAWSVPSGWSLSSNVATGSGVTAYLLPASNGILTVGKQYAVTVTQSSYTSGTVYMYVGTGAPNGYYYASLPSTTGTYTFTLTAYNTNFGIYGANYTGVIDNVTISLAEEDRSIRGKGLQVFGTVTKTAVATGAELVGYNASNSTSYLEQPYNSELDFGTAGDFHYSFWVYSDSNATYNGATYIFERTSVGDPSSRRIEARLDTSTNLQVYATSAVFVTGSTGITIVTDSWNKVDIIRKSNVGSVWVNGVQKVSGSHSGNMTDTNAKLTVCNRGYFNPHNQGFPTGIALFRVSATAPTLEQIKKMYNDEKHLFQPNAKATLYGTSDAVTALAYDDDTELLHAGTSAGRSVFQGLNRVDNTTDAVGAAISASNGFIVEE